MRLFIKELAKMFLQGLDVFMRMRSLYFPAVFGVVGRVLHAIRMDVHMLPFLVMLSEVHQRMPNVRVFRALAARRDAVVAAISMRVQF